MKTAHIPVVIHVTYHFASGLAVCGRAMEGLPCESCRVPTGVRA